MSTTVLVVEDDPEISELIGEYLALENIQPIAALNGKAGISVATDQHPDAIILDLMLPDIDGYEVARTLSSQRSTADIPIIILSCMCLPNDKEKGFGSGARFYMSKPFLPDDLLATVREALQWKTLLKAGTGTGTISAGANLNDSLKSIHQMSAELLTRTTLPESDVNTMRQAIESLDTWTRQWNTEHKSEGNLRIDYQIPDAAQVGGASSLPQVEWKLTESSPGILEQAFFKAPPSGGSAGGGLIGWGAATFLSKPIAPLTIPARWLEILSKTGAAVFEKNSKARSVAFSRQEKGPQASLANGAVPVVEVGPVPTRRKEQPVAKA